MRLIMERVAQQAHEDDRISERESHSDVPSSEGAHEEGNTIDVPRQSKCLARTRKGGLCQKFSIGSKERCRLHGGASTGPRTLKGREKIAEAQRIRWERWRRSRLPE